MKNSKKLSYAHDIEKIHVGGYKGNTAYYNKKNGLVYYLSYREFHGTTQCEIGHLEAGLSQQEAAKKFSEINK